MLPFRPVIKTTIQVIRATRDAIKPFKELPPDTVRELEGKKDETDSKGICGITASELFSLFTANIVNQEQVFVR